MKDDQVALYSEIQKLSASLNEVGQKLDNLQADLEATRTDLNSRVSEVDSVLGALKAQPALEPREKVITAANEAVQKLSLGKTQDQILEIYLQEVAPYLDRAIVFLHKEGRYSPWKSFGFEAHSIESVVAEGDLDPIVRAAQRKRIIYRADDLAGAFTWLERCGEIPKTSICIPLVFNNYVPLVLYGDSSGSIALESLELLTHLTVLILQNHYLNMLVESYESPKETDAEPEATAEPGKVPGETPSHEDFPPPALAKDVASPFAQEPPPGETLVSPPDGAPEETPKGEEPISPEGAVAKTEVESEPEKKPEEEPPPEKEPGSLSEVEEETATAPGEETEEEPERKKPSRVKPFIFPSRKAAEPAAQEAAQGQPAGADLKEVAAEEDRLHAEALRFARLLVSEIKLYNEQQVEQGREERDLYSRLSMDIDRSRTMYDKRAHPSVRESKDHFHDELVRILGGGDAGALGEGYPGSQV